MTDIGITAQLAEQLRIEREDGVFQVFYTRGAMVISVILMCEKLRKNELSLRAAIKRHRSSL